MFFSILLVLEPGVHCTFVLVSPWVLPAEVCRLWKTKAPSEIIRDRFEVVSRNFGQVFVDMGQISRLMYMLKMISWGFLPQSFVLHYFRFLPGFYVFFRAKETLWSANVSEPFFRNFINSDRVRILFAFFLFKKFAYSPKCFHLINTLFFNSSVTEVPWFPNTLKWQSNTASNTL